MSFSSYLYTFAMLLISEGNCSIESVAFEKRRTYDEIPKNISK